MRVEAARVVKRLGFTPVPHISARRLGSPAMLQEFLATLQADGTNENLFVVGGDPAQPQGPYEDSLAVIRSGLLERYGVRHISVSGYPEGHPAIIGPALWSAIEGKAAAFGEQRLAGDVITQFGFDVDPVLTWVEAVRGRGLLDLLWRRRRGQLPITVAMVISNHPDVAEEVRGFGIPFFYVPSMGPDRSAAEAEHLRLLQGNVDFIVLARYMRILSGDFIVKVDVPIINIHHSFLPAFIGARPYAKAKERGVKLIGATAHYVTEDLDEGPIIEQDVVRVTHADTVADLQRRGADVERAVLSRAVHWHSEDRVIRNGNHTIVLALRRWLGSRSPPTTEDMHGRGLQQ
ncbi:formyltetrahydrofolate deformylase [Pseudofrankia sp. BMG5.37]|nr:formyltetrahydrofolate deformylase [Pseudofrankia sp. BMG5.37]MDT3442820.1 formyltetrahydrofolate deformylase [Pseudofrankia sp. BMG5.37]